MKFKKCALYMTSLIIVFFNNNPCLSLSNDSLLQDIKLRIYYNEKPDSLFINDQLYDIQLSGDVISIEIQSKNYIRAVKKGYEPYYQELHNLKKYVLNNVRLLFKIKDNITEDFTPEQFSNLPVYNLLGKDYILSKSKKNTLIIGSSSFHCLTSILISNQLGLESGVNNTLLIGSLAQYVGWLIKQYINFNSQTGVYKDNRSVSPHFLSIGFSSSIDFEYTDSERIGMPTINKSISLTPSLKGAIYLDYEKYISEYFFINTSIYFSPSVNLEYKEILSYGQPPNNTYIISETIDEPLLFISFDFNYIFARILNQECAVGVGVDWLASMDINKKLTIPNNAFPNYLIQEHYTNIDIKLGSFSLSPGFTVHSPITDKISFITKYNYLIYLNSDTDESIIGNSLNLWQIGFRYNL